jgi:hypothetical protein
MSLKTIDDKLSHAGMKLGRNSIGALLHHIQKWEFIMYR